MPQPVDQSLSVKIHLETKGEYIKASVLSVPFEVAGVAMPRS